jgi:hypothetical protein
MLPRRSGKASFVRLAISKLSSNFPSLSAGDYSLDSGARLFAVVKVELAEACLAASLLPFA